MPPHRTEHRAESMDSHDNTRKRVCKACDRCRLKKSKCDGSSPCSRCKADNSICVFGERKKSQDKVYPKGYVEMLEQQQTQLVAGLRELYTRLQRGEIWPGQPLRETSEGHPLTHDILERLDLLRLPNNSESHYEGFEEDITRMQQKLVDGGAPFTRRRGSVSSDSEHGHASSSSSYNGTPTTKSFSFHSPFIGNNAPPTPPMNSPFPRQSQVIPPVKQEAPLVSSEFIPQGALDTSALSCVGWLNDSGLMEDPIDFSKPMYGFDDFNNYNQTMLVDSIAIVPSDPMMPNWNSPNDLDFSNFLQNSVGA